MPIAVIKTGGKQYLVEPGVKLRVEKLPVEAGKSINFDQVLLMAERDGQQVKVGNPTVAGAKVTGKVLAQGRADKVTVIKYKPKVRYRRKAGHRQAYTEVLVESVG